MNRKIQIAILLIAMGSGPAAVAQENIAAPTLTLDWHAFESIAQKNIFDPTRTGATRLGNRPRPKIIRTFTFRGAADDIVFVTGEGTPSKGYVKTGDLLNGFKVLQIAPDLDQLKLADPSGTIVVLKTGESMRREEDGPWTKTDQPAPEPSASSSTTVSTGDSSAAPSASSGTSSSSGPAGESDILKRLRLKREQEEK